MPLADELKTRVTAAMKSGDTATRDTLRTVLGEAQSEAMRQKAEVTDQIVVGVVKKAVTGLKETIPLAQKDGRDTKAQEAELALLEGLLPKVVDKGVVLVHLTAIKDQLKAAKNDGQAMGVAMKSLKEAGLTVNADDVKAGVAAVRAL